MMFSLQMVNQMEKLNREMDQLFCGLGWNVVPEKRVDSSGLRVKDAGEVYRVEAALPGIDTGKLEINVLGRRLSVSAEMAAADTGESVVWHRRERRREAFNHSLMLPTEIDSDKVEAEYENGILSILIPKAVSVLPKKITVKAV